MKENNKIGGNKMNKTVKEYLIENGYDGLYCKDCSCKTNELFPCSGLGGYIHKCKAGYKTDCGYHITRDKP